MLREGRGGMRRGDPRESAEIIPQKRAFAVCDDSVKNAQTGLEDFTGIHSWSEAVGGTLKLSALSGSSP